MSVATKIDETQNKYNEDDTLNCEGAVKLNIAVFNNPIYYRYIPRTHGHPNLGSWSPEVYLAPAERFLRRNAQRVQVRSAVEGKPAVVVIEALMPGD